MRALFLLCFIFATFVQMAGAQLRLTYPNGGESFTGNTKLTITWTGVAASEIVTLEYSLDGGTTWTLITNSATNLSYTWISIVNTTSTQCLIRVSHSMAVVPSQLNLFANGHFGNADFSADGNEVIGGSSDGNTYIWDSHSGNLLHTFQTEIGVGIPGLQALNWWAEFSPDMKTFVTASPSTDPSPFGNMIRVWDTNTGTKLREWHLENLKDDVHSSAMCRFSPDGTRIATTGTDSIYVLDPSTGAIVSKLSGFVKQEAFGSDHGVASSLDWKADASEIIAANAFADDSLPSYVRANSISGDTIRTYKLHTHVPFFSENDMIHYSPDGTKFIVSSEDTSVRVWDIVGDSILWRIQPGLRGVVDAVFSHDGKNVATIGYDSLGSNSYNVKLWDAMTGAFLKWVGSIGIATHTIEFSPDDSRLLISSYGLNIILQNPSGGTEDDVSDGPWTITANTGGNIVVYTPNSSGHIADEITVPVLIDNPGNAIAGGATQVSFDLTFNATMLDPISTTQRGTIAGNLRTLSYTLPINPNDTILTLLHFKVALGNDSQTTISVVSPTTNAPSVTATKVDGMFSLLDICYAGGARLLNPNGAVTMIVPQNPAKDVLEIRLNLIEDGRTSLQLCDASGREIMRPLDEITLHGARVLRIPCKSLPSGCYYLHLQTPNNSINTRVEVLR